MRLLELLVALGVALFLVLAIYAFVMGEFIAAFMLGSVVLFFIIMIVRL